MTSLTPESRAILEAGQAADPGLDDVTRARMKRQLLAKLAVGGAAATTATVAAAETGAATAAAATTGGLSLLTKVGLTVSFVAATSVGAVFVSVDREPTPPAMTTPVTEEPAEPTTTTPTAQAPPPSTAVAVPSAAPDPKTAPAEAPRPVPAVVEAPPPASPSSLAEETALLQRAQRELQDGDPERALELLDREGGRHEGGVLQEEREAARVIALCRAGRVAEGHAAQRRFLAAHPRSPHRTRVLAACP